MQGTNNKNKDKRNFSIWDLITNPKQKAKDVKEKTKEGQETIYYSITEEVNSSQQVQKLIADANHVTTERRRKELKEKGKLKGWQKQTGLGSIPMFQVLIEIEAAIKGKLKICYDSLDDKTYGQWNNIFGSISSLENNLKWAQMMLDEFRYQRNNPRLAFMGNNKRKKQNGRRNTERTKGTSSRKAGNSGSNVKRKD